MLEWYLLSVIGFAFGFDQHRTVLLANHPYPTLVMTPFLFDTAAWVGGVATLCMLIGGLFFSVWWWPLLAMIIGTGTNYLGRRVMPMEFRWFSSMGGTLVGLAATLILVN